MNRISKDDYYLEIAKAVSLRSTCLRAHAGVIIVRNDAIVSTGYSGSPKGEPNCCDIGKCKRIELGISPGERYELCESVHGEMNAIINAARNGACVFGGIMYIFFVRLDGQKKKHGGPCLLCRRMMKNAGITGFKIKEIV
jgi:dCMP deaminase